MRTRERALHLQHDQVAEQALAQHPGGAAAAVGQHDRDVAAVVGEGLGDGDDVARVVPQQAQLRVDGAVAAARARGRGRPVGLDADDRGAQGGRDPRVGGRRGRGPRGAGHRGQDQGEGAERAHGVERGGTKKKPPGGGFVQERGVRP